MYLHLAKKSAMQTLVNIAIILIGFIIIISVIYQFFSKADEAAAEAICRASVAAREKTFKETLGGAGPNLKLSPILCKTIDKELPIKKEGTRDDIKKDFGELIAKCWWQFGQGLVDGKKIFGEKFPLGKDKCFICYTATVRSTKYFSKAELITKSDLESWLSQHFYEAIETRHSYTQQDSSRRKTECEQKGGECLQKCTPTKKVFSEWNCPPRKVCCVDRENLMSYLDYVQSSGGEGRIAIVDGLTIKPGETYAVSIAFDTPKNWWFDWKWPWNAGNIDRILLTRLSDVENHCYVQKDIQGK